MNAARRLGWRGFTGAWQWLLRLPGKRDLLLSIMAAVLSFVAVSFVLDRLDAQRRTELVRTAALDASYRVELLRLNWIATLQRARELHELAKVLYLDMRNGSSPKDIDDDWGALIEAQRNLGGLNEFTQVSVVDAFGMSALSTLKRNGAPVDLSDRPHIRAILDGNTDLFVSEPLLGRISGQWTVQIARPIRDRNGVLIGVTVVSYLAETASRYLDHSLLQVDDIYAIIRNDGAFIARSGAYSVNRHSQFAGICNGPSPPAQAFNREGRSVTDGRERIYALACVPDSGTFVGVGLDRERILAPRVAVDRALRVAGVMYALMVGVMTLLVRAQLRRRRDAQRMQAEQRELLADLTFFRELTDNVGDGLMKFDDRLRVQFASRAAAAMFGVTPETMSTSTLFDLVPPHQAGALRRMRFQVLAAEETFSTELELPTPDGAIRQVEAVSVARLMSGQERKSVFTVLRDITERRSLLAELAHSRAELQAMIDAGPGALFTLRLDRDGRVIAAAFSNAITRLLGYAREEAEQPDWFDQVVDPACAEQLAGLRRATLALEPASAELCIRHRNGRWRWVRETIRPEWDEARQEIRAVAYLIDITLDKLREAQLAQAAKLAQLGELATSMAHELNQPLAIMSLAAENTLADLDRPDGGISARRRLHRIRTQASRASQLIDHLRVFGRTRTRSQVAVSLSDAVADALILTRAKLHHSGVKIERVGLDRLPRVRGDAVLLEQVLMNLIGNACDAYDGLGTESAPIARAVHIGGQEADGIVTLSVADHAGGVPPEVIDRIFEPFFTTKPVGKGTWLGLSFSYGVVNDMGGSLTVRNENGGAVFEIRLPAFGAGAAAPARAEETLTA